MNKYDFITTNKITGESKRHLISAGSVFEAKLIVENRVGDSNDITLIDSFKELCGVTKGLFHRLFEPVHGYILVFESIEDTLFYLIEQRLIPENSFYEIEELDEDENYLAIWCDIDGEKEFTDYSINFIRMVDNVLFNTNNKDYEETEYWRD